MLPIIGWELVYADGSKFTSGDGPWGQAPGTGVQVLVLVHEPPYRTLEYGLDHYLLPGETARKRGDWMPDPEFHALVRDVTGAA